MDRKVREEIMPVESYLGLVRDGDISEDQDVQRSFCSGNSFVNGIAVTVTTGDYLPPIILAEVPYENNTKQLYIVDANQRTAALQKLRFGNYKITSSVENSEITYQAKKLDDDGNIIRDDNGSIIWEQKVFDIKNKTYDDFPNELKKAFNNFQLRVVTHTNCTINDVSKLVRRYNNHKAMNPAQRALTYLDVYARKVKNIVRNNNFFKDTIEYKDAERQKGLYEKCICECVMSVRYTNDWKKDAKAMSTYLNNNAEEKDFDIISNYATRIHNVCGDRFQNIFVLKNIAVWFKAFDLLNGYGIEDSEFAKFVEVFDKELQFKRYGENSFYDLEQEKGTKDKRIIHEKIEILDNAMKEYFHLKKTEKNDQKMSNFEENNGKNDYILVPEELKEYVEEYKNSDTILSLGCDTRKTDRLAIDTLNFVQQNVNKDKDYVDVELYMSILDDWTANISQDSWIMRERNIVSLVGIVAYACEIEMDSEAGDWFVEFEKHRNVWRNNDLEKFKYMQASLNKFLGLDSE